MGFLSRVQRSVLLLLTLIFSPLIVSAADVTLTWNANAESDLAGYKVYYGTAPSVYQNPVIVGKQTTYIVTNLGSGTWFFAVTAVNNIGIESDFSDEVRTVIGTGSDSTEPTISSVVSTGITNSSATITWLTNEAADSQIQYGTSTSYSNATPLDSNRGTNHSQTLSNLSAGVLYHFRVLSRDAAGNLATSTDYTFTTTAIVSDNTPPTISSVGSSNITPVGATITWTTNEAADSQIQYGLSTAYGSSTTLDSNRVLSHSQALNNLSIGTLYHYRVLSRDAAGNLAASTDFTFTTATVTIIDTTPPIISSVAVNNITSSGATITWTTDEAADSQIQYGASTSYSNSTALDSNRGTNHSQTLSNLNAGTLYHYRILSRDASSNLAVTSDLTFATAASPDPDTSTPIFVQQNSNRISMGRILTSSFGNTNRAGNLIIAYVVWDNTNRISISDSNSNTYNSAIGPTQYNRSVQIFYAKNIAGGANTVRVNFSQSISSIGALYILEYSGIDTISPLEAAVVASGSSFNMNSGTLTTRSPNSLLLAAGTSANTITGADGNFTVRASDRDVIIEDRIASIIGPYNATASQTGNSWIMQLVAFKAGATNTQDNIPPTISSVASFNITNSSATIAWNTDEAADSQIQYGLSASFGNSTNLDSNRVTAHSQTLSGLMASSLYHYRVLSRDAAGNLAASGTFTFTTVGEISSDNTPPAISSVVSSGITDSGAIITWVTNEAADSLVQYGASTSYGSSTALNSNREISHTQAIGGLSASSLYHYRVLSRDAAGNLAASPDFTFTTAMAPDNTPPAISSVASSGITSSSATVTWFTNEAADSQIQYGTSTSYSSSTALNSNRGNSHSQALSNLSASTLYHYSVLSRDAAGNLAASPDFTFSTTAAPDNTPPSISYVASSGITESSATITWTTNEAADSQVQYGASTSYGSSTALNSNRVTSHFETLSNLSAGTLYHYRVLSRDEAGNLATSTDFIFATAGSQDTTPPSISSVASSSVTDSSATITWATNEAADSQVQHGTSTSYGSSTALNSNRVTAHSQSLSGLSASTLYYYRVLSRDEAGNLATSDDFTFTTTAAPDTDTPTLVQQNSSRINIGRSLTVPFANGNKAGNLIVAYIVWDNDSPISISDSNGNTYTSAVGPTQYNSSVQIFYAKNITDGTNTVRVNFSRTINSRAALYILEYSGIDPDSPLEAVTAATGTSFNMNSGILRTKNPNSLLFAAGTAENKITGSDSNFALRTSNRDALVEDRVASTVGSYNATARQAGRGWIMQLVAFKAAGQTSQSTVALPVFPTEDVQSTTGNGSYLGVAVANSDSKSATLKFTAVDSAGNAMTGPGITNPVVRTLNPGEQLSTTDNQLFGNAVSNLRTNSWIRMESTTPKIGGFFSTFNSDMSVLEAVKISSTPMKSIVFTDLEDFGTTKISASNTGSQSGTVTIDLVRADGSVINSVVRTINANGVMIADLFTDLFSGITPSAADYVRASMSGGLQAYQLLRSASGDVRVLQGQDVDAGASVLYAPNFDFGSGQNTTLSIVNVGSTSGTLALRFISDNGSQLGITRTVPIQPNGKIQVDGPLFFQILENSGKGYVEIISNGTKLVGSATFSNGSQSSTSSLPLISKFQSPILFSNVNSNDFFSTGIVLLNPSSNDALITINLFAANGALIAGTADVVPARQRISRMINEYFPTVSAGSMTSGYITITADKPVAAFSRIITSGGSILSAVPLQDIP